MRRSGRIPLAPGEWFRLLVLLLIFGGVLLLALLTDAFDDLEPSDVHRWVRHAGVWAPAFYLAGFLVRPFTLIPLTVWLVAGGIAFGWGRGALLALIGGNLGAAFTFLLARTLGRDLVRRLLKRLGGGRLRPARWSARFVLGLQLLPFMHHDVLNLAAACSHVPYWRFFLGSSLGTLPGIMLYTYAGSVLMAPGSTAFYIAFLALCILSLVSLAAARRLRRTDAARPFDGDDADAVGEPPEPERARA